MTYTYYYVGSQLARMTYGDYVLDFFYDVNGTPLAMRQGYLSSNNYTVYYYITNLQGDVIRLVDVNGSTAAYYEYDPYGNAIQAAGSHCNINPLRYRGYIYDSETSLYYLQSRYYDPATGRFINADGYLTTEQGLLSNNLFAYCLNNPVCRKDSSGTTSVDIYEPEGNPLTDDDERIDGGKINGSGDSTNTQTVNVGGSTKTPNQGSLDQLGEKVEGNNYAGNSGRTEVHHVVEQCQVEKSGFNKSDIRSSNNTVILDYNLHRAVSGYYSSKPPEFGGLRVRDWLAGQSFAAQTAFGWNVINMLYNQRFI